VNTYGYQLWLCADLVIQSLYEIRADAHYLVLFRTQLKDLSKQDRQLKKR
jgi:hypothetical protein